MFGEEKRFTLKTRMEACKKACDAFYKTLEENQHKKGLIDLVECDEKVFVINFNNNCKYMFFYED